MRIVDRKAFLALPAGTLYAKGKPMAFGGLLIKEESCNNDWFYIDPAQFDFDNTEQFVNRFDAMLKEGASFPCDTSTQRDGLFDDDDVFLVLDKDDLLVLRNFVDRAIAIK